MLNDERLKRLKDLVARLEQLPPSPERDRVLTDARARAVDVDTGETTRPMRDVDADLAAIARDATRSARPAAPGAPPPAAAPAPAPLLRPERPAPVWAERLPALDEGAPDPFEIEDADDWVLNVEEDDLPQPEAPHARPWTLGLRG